MRAQEGRAWVTQPPAQPCGRCMPEGAVTKGEGVSRLDSRSGNPWHALCVGDAPEGASMGTIPMLSNAIPDGFVLFVEGWPLAALFIALVAVGALLAWRTAPCDTYIPPGSKLRTLQSASPGEDVRRPLAA